MDKRFRNGIKKLNKTTNTKWLNYDHQWAGIEKLVKVLDSNCNFYKVESHTILTRTLFLFYTYGVIVSFEPHFETITFKDKDGNEHTIVWKCLDDLNRFLYRLLQSSEYSNDLSNAYSDYRQATRLITDHLDENHNPRVTWVKILELSKKYFDDMSNKKVQK